MVHQIEDERFATFHIRVAAMVDALLNSDLSCETKRVRNISLKAALITKSDIQTEEMMHLAKNFENSEHSAEIHGAILYSVGKVGYSKALQAHGKQQTGHYAWVEIFSEMN